MIVVVEGISASGKTTSCAKHGHGRVIPENPRRLDAPDAAYDPTAAAAFWVQRNVDRWQAALAVEEISQWAVCDTDPLKLHYVWCLWQIGQAERRDWFLQLSATREKVWQRKIGFAEYYVIGQIEPQLARERAHEDTFRRRRQFELHVRLQSALMMWYTALDRILPGRVQFSFPAEMPVMRDQGKRYDLVAFDRMIATLPEAPGSTA